MSTISYSIYKSLDPVFRRSLASVQSTQTSTKRYLNYGRSWKNVRRVQNPDIVKQMLVNKYVKESNFKKTRLVYVCGQGVLGSLGLSRFYQPEKDPDEYEMKDAENSTFRRLPVFDNSDTIIDIACGYGFTLIAANMHDTTHSVIGFGLNSHSQIGYHETRLGKPLEIVGVPGSVFAPTKEPIIKVACGRSHSMMLDKRGKVFSMGCNSLGQCGRKINADEVYSGSKVVHHIQELPDDIEQIECGQDHTLFVTKNGKVFACGWGADGQTGLGHYKNQEIPHQVKGDIDGARIIKVSSYADTTLALDSSGNVFGWGNTEYAQFRTLGNCESEQFNVPRLLKLNRVPGKIVDIAAGGTICALLNEAGQVFVWGFGILGKGPQVDQSSHPTLIPETLFGMNHYNIDVKVEKIYASLSHYAAITNRGDLYTWGKNRGACLGFKHAQDQFFPMQVDMNMGTVKKLGLGVDHTCAILEKIC